MKLRKLLGPAITTLLVNIYYIGLFVLFIYVNGIDLIILIPLILLPIVLSLMASNFFAKKLAEEEDANKKKNRNKK